MLKRRGSREGRTTAAAQLYSSLGLLNSVSIQKVFPPSTFSTQSLQRGLLLCFSNPRIFFNPDTCKPFHQILQLNRRDEGARGLCSQCLDCK